MRTLISEDLANPYSQLESRWDESTRQWTWLVPTLEQIPDVAVAIDISPEHQLATGPMMKV
jgi:hypothetical protein